MGDPKLQKKKYAKPAHPWQKDRIVSEEELVRDYGLKNKKELWKANSIARNFARQAKKLIAATGPQAELEKEQLFSRIFSLGIVNENPSLDDVLGITINNILDRRLQTIVYKKGLARSSKQARQFIIHEHIIVNGKKINSPSYLVTRNEEEKIAFDENSVFTNPEHPERTPLNKESEEKKRKKKQNRGENFKNQRQQRRRPVMRTRRAMPEKKAARASEDSK